MDKIVHNNQILAIIIPKDFNSMGVHFFTPHDFSQQLAYMRHPTGKTIPSHVHNPNFRKVNYTQEVLILKKGKLRVDFYDKNCCYLESRVLVGGDVILLATGGHGFEVLEEVEMIEVKQGPHTGSDDKTCFLGVQKDRIAIKKGDPDA